ncbi:MAG: exopolysaccharide Pel transporter PelG [Lachnospiraceae bacterium]|nr:exopolysaccharide Pel transporter PelG [Lachnospiraceae bacterium]MDE6814629.1 exopolysaccharide Pel transporter PelG [Lachnospiraceae bacterium]
MAGVGIKLNRIFEKKSIAADLVGFTYSIVITIAPIILVIANILLMGWILGFGEVAYLERELFSCTVLYTFIFALLTVAPFNAVLSKYVQDSIYEERYQDILPCYYLGLVMNLVLSCVLGIGFCLWEHFVGGVEVFYVFIGYCAYISMVLVFYSMVYLSICKDYERISLFFLLGMLEAFVLGVVLRYLFRWDVMHAMLFALMTGFFLIAILEFTAVKRYFLQNSNRYKPVLLYFKKWWKLVVTNFLYTLGLYIHNFVFWTDEGRMVVVKSFVCNQPYDMATCLAMFTNISATIIFVTRVEMFFHEKYKLYSEAVIGGKKTDIENTKNRMFRQLADELMNLARVQFIISVVVYLLCVVLLPQFGFAGMVMRIYPCLAAGYFILFLMYSAMLFLYYYNDLTGAVLTTLGFCLVTCIGSIAATHLPEIWYGIGVVLGSLTGWTIAYIRLRWVEKHLDIHIFCQGMLLKRGIGLKPSGKVFEK